MTTGEIFLIIYLVAGFLFALFVCASSDDKISIRSVLVSLFTSPFLIIALPVFIWTATDIDYVLWKRKK